jgi:hypothetical protein
MPCRLVVLRHTAQFFPTSGEIVNFKGLCEPHGNFSREFGRCNCGTEALPILDWEPGDRGCLGKEKIVPGTMEGTMFEHNYVPMESLATKDAYVRVPRARAGRLCIYGVYTND